MRRFLPALVLSVAIVLAAPFLAVLRDLLVAAIRHPLSRASAAVIGLLVVIGAGLWLAAAGPRRQRVMMGAGSIGLVVALQQLAFRTGDAGVDLVELLHLIEYGSLAFLLDRSFRRPGKETLQPSEVHSDAGTFVLPLLLGTLVGILDETVQWLAPQRVGDLRDIGIDGLGALCGVLFAWFLHPPRRWRRRWSPSSRTRVLRVASVTFLAATGFVCVAHLGHVVVEPEVGGFLSSYTREELLRVAEDRERRWAENPPTELPLWGVEDRFLSEAAWHARFRNNRYKVGDLAGAWPANRILELYYGPFLDLESFRGSGPNRWGPALLRQIEEQRPPHHAPTYMSPVLRNRLVPWPRSVVVGLGTALAAVLWWAGRPRSPHANRT